MILRSEALLAILSAAGFVCLFGYPTLSRLSGIGVVWDWAEFLQRNWVSFYSISRFHQIPLWNPYDCGGMPLLAHPTSAFLSPLFALQLVLGPLVGLHLQILAHLAIAWTGGYVLARIQGMSVMGKLTCASIFPASSWFWLHVAVGHINFLPEAYLPWIMVLVWLGFERDGILPLAAGGALLAIMFGEGGVYPCTQAVLLVSLVALALALLRKSLWPISCLAVVVLFAIGFAAIKLLPAWCMMRLHPRPIAELEYNPLRVLLAGLFTRNQFYDRQRLGQWGFWEVGAYLSPIAIILAALGAAFSPRRAAAWLIAAAIFFVLAIGAPESWYPWALLHRLPIVSSERVPNRSLIPFTLAVAVIAGFGADILARYRKPIGATIGLAFMLAAIFDQWLVCKPNLTAAVAGELPTLSPSPEFRQVYEDTWSMFTISMSNLGALHCNEELDFRDVSKMKVVGSNQPGYRGEQYLLGPGSVALARWTPNVLSYDVYTPVSNVLIVNQNYDANWRLVRGNGDVFSQNELIGVHLDPGSQHLRLVYRSYAFLVGMAVTVLTSVFTLFLWRRCVYQHLVNSP
jgi:hypothetical protein